MVKEDKEMTTVLHVSIENVNEFALWPVNKIKDDSSMLINLHCEEHVQKPRKTKYDVTIHEKIQEAIREIVGDDLTVTLFLAMNTLAIKLNKEYLKNIKVCKLLSVMLLINNHIPIVVVVIAMMT